MNNQIVFIAGLSHIGSTLIDYTLGSNPGFVGLGEVYTALRPELNRINQEVYCSCGKMVDGCPFWGEAAKYIRPKLNAPMGEKYLIILKVFKDIFGEDRIMVDSSKSLDALKIVSSLPETDLKVINLIRDVRSWTISRLDIRKKSSQNFTSDGFYLRKLSYTYGWKVRILRWIIPYITKRASYYFLLWYYLNRQITDFLNAKGISFFRLGYDELGMDPGLMMSKVFQYLEVEHGNPDFCIENTKSHVLLGNPKKSDPKRRDKIMYDNRWMYRNECLIPAAIFLNIMRYNKEEVYQNISADSIWG